MPVLTGSELAGLSAELDAAREAQRETAAALTAYANRTDAAMTTAVHKLADRLSALEATSLPTAVAETKFAAADDLSKLFPRSDGAALTKRVEQLLTGTRTKPRPHLYPYITRRVH